MLAEIGALNSLGHDRRSAMWQVERDSSGGRNVSGSSQYPEAGSQESPLEEMNISSLIADYQEQDSRLVLIRSRSVAANSRCVA
jgi:hypothetical protein